MWCRDISYSINFPSLLFVTANPTFSSIFNCFCVYLCVNFVDKLKQCFQIQIDGNPNFWGGGGGGGAKKKYMAESMILEGGTWAESGEIPRPPPLMKSWQCSWVGVCYLKLDSWVWHPLHYVYRHSSCHGAFLTKDVNCWAFAQSLLKLNWMIQKVAQDVDLVSSCTIAKRKEEKIQFLSPLGSVCKTLSKHIDKIAHRTWWKFWDCFLLEIFVLCMYNNQAIPTYTCIKSIDRFHNYV